jgi:hypothetical protein
VNVLNFLKETTQLFGDKSAPHSTFFYELQAIQFFNSKNVVQKNIKAINA